MTVTRKKRPRDPVQLGELIVEIAKGQGEEREDDGKDAAAAEMRRKGGAACAAKLSAEQRAEIARKGAAKRSRIPRMDWRSASAVLQFRGVDHALTLDQVAES
jgi:hypothetical protein